MKALEKNPDNAALKELFHMFAVTQEDFVHPMAVIELLWQSCCALEAEEAESTLATRLKVRQRTQLLVDHSLLLGSAREGIHLHDMVLSFLRKRLSAEELRTMQRRVVEGMVSASEKRIKATGRGLEDTGTRSVRKRLLLNIDSFVDRLVRSLLAHSLLLLAATSPSTAKR